MLSFARHRTAEQGRGDRKRRHHCGRQINDGAADPRRRPVRLAGDRHQAGNRLHRAVIGGRRRKRPLLSVAGNRAVDDVRFDCAHRLIAKAEPGQHAGAEVLHDDVGAGGEAGKHLGGARVLHVERHRPLVGVHRQEVRRHADPANVIVRHDAAALVTSDRFLDLDDVSAEEGELLGAGWPSEDLREVEHADAREGLGHYRCSTNLTRSRSLGILSAFRLPGDRRQIEIHR